MRSSAYVHSRRRTTAPKARAIPRARSWLKTPHCTAVTTSAAPMNQKRARASPRCRRSRRRSRRLSNGGSSGTGETLPARGWREGPDSCPSFHCALERRRPKGLGAGCRASPSHARERDLTSPQPAGRAGRGCDEARNAVQGGFGRAEPRSEELPAAHHCGHPAGSPPGGGLLGIPPGAPRDTSSCEKL